MKRVSEESVKPDVLMFAAAGADKVGSFEPWCSDTASLGFAVQKSDSLLCGVAAHRWARTLVLQPPTRACQKGRSKNASVSGPSLRVVRQRVGAL